VRDHVRALIDPVNMRPDTYVVALGQVMRQISDEPDFFFPSQTGAGSTYTIVGLPPQVCTAC
jgi:hypothetical protein